MAIIMNIDSIQNGIVIDHIPAGKGMELYGLLNLEALDCQVAIIKNASSGKMGRKDIIKIDAAIDVDFDLLGYTAPGATINIIKNGVLAEKKTPDLPEELVGVLKCKNPRCISTTEQELPQIFRLADRGNRVYRCLYCEAKA
jgi:aspartate carbamoyltransferase regulatory subunit